MSHSYHGRSAIQALYRVFVLPALPKVILKTPRPVHVQQHRTFTSTPLLLAKTRVAETRSQKWNEEINARIIQLVDPTTNKLSEPVTRYDVLNSLDQKTHRLVQLTADPPPGERDGWIPTCKIISKKESYESEKRAKEVAKEKKKVAKITSGEGLKTLELNWAIDQNDLGHRINRIKEFLSEGRRVEVVLAAKKRGRKASREECEVVLERIRKAVDEVEGARQREAMTGKIGGFVTMVFQGRPVVVKAGSVGEQRQEDEEEVEEDALEKKRRRKWDKKDKETLNTVVGEKEGQDGKLGGEEVPRL